MRRSLLSVPLLVYFLSATAQAGPVTIGLLADDVRMTFSPAGASLDLGTYLSCHECAAEAAGHITILAGPLIGLTVTRDADGNPVSSLYEYPDASVTFDGDVLDLDDGSVGHGVFTARLPMFQFTVVNEGGSWPPGATIAEELNFVDGLFDPELAAVFGVRERFNQSSLFLSIEDITGTPDSPTERTSHSFLNDGWIDAEAIPEPSTTMLCLLAAAGVLARRRHVGGVDRIARDACGTGPTAPTV